MPSYSEIMNQLVPLPVAASPVPMIAPLAPSQDTITDQLTSFYRPTSIPFTRHSPLPVQAMGANVANSQSISQTQTGKSIFGITRNLNQIPGTMQNGGTSPNIAAGSGIGFTSSVLGSITIAYTGFFAPITHKFLTGLNASDTFSAAQPDFTDLSGKIALSQTQLTTNGDFLTVIAGVLARGVFGDSEIPSGTINSSNTVFTLASAPNPAASLQLYKNGVLQTGGGVDYTLSSATITYVTAPATGDTHVCWYRH